MSRNERHPAPQQPVSAPEEDPATDRIPVVPPRARQCHSLRRHKARAGEVAALAFCLPHAIPAQRRPVAAEYRPAS